MKKHLPLLALCWLLLPGSTALAAKHEQCNIVRLSDMGEPELVIKTAAAAAVLEILGYRPQTQAFSQKETFAALAKGTVDAFFGANPRKMDKPITALLEAGQVEIVGVNQTFALAVAPSATTGSGELAAAATIPRLGPPKSVASLPGTANAPDGAENVKPEADKPANLGVQTLIGTGYAGACPNVATFLRNLTFPPDMSVFVTNRMANEYDELFDAVAMWLGENQDVLDIWLAGVTTIDGADANAVVRQEFGL